MNATVKYIRGNAKCRRVHDTIECGARMTEHADGRCPGNPDATYSPTSKSSHRVSLSLSEQAVDAAAHIVNGLLIGKSAAELRAHKGFTDFAKVVIGTAQRVKAREAKR